MPTGGTCRWFRSGNDHWRSEVPIRERGTYRFRIEGWIDTWATWRSDLEKRLGAGQDVAGELREGAALVGAAARRARAAGADDDAARLKEASSRLRRKDTDAGVRRSPMSDDLHALMSAHPDRRRGAAASPEFVMVAARERARHGAWYELFPRSASPDPARHGTLRDVAALVPEIAELGFDVLYLPPIHPIGQHQPEGPQQHDDAGPRRIRGARGRSARRPAGTPRSIPTSARSTTSSTCSRS